MTEQELENLIRSRNPEHISWGALFNEKGWTESIIREYCIYFTPIDWILLLNFHGSFINLDFAREFKKQLKGRDEELYYFGKLI